MAKAHKTKRLTIIETPHYRESIMGSLNCVVANAWCTNDPAPTLLVGSVLLANLRSGWVLSHLLIEDECRRAGFATEIVRFYEEERFTNLGAAWVSEAGEAFARKYIERFGPRPHWRVGPDPEVDALLERMGVKLP